MDLSNALGIAQVVEGLWPTLAGFGNMRKDQAARPGAAAAYLAYESAATRSVVNLGVMVGVGIPPRFIGGLWSWPAVYRAHQRFVDAVGDMMVAFGQMVMLGDYGVVEAAYDFSRRLGDCSKDLPTVRGRLGTRIAMTDEYQARLNAAYGDLRAFILAARNDLEIKGRTNPRREIEGPGAPEATADGTTAGDPASEQRARTKLRGDRAVRRPTQ
jgi:hypothetical protein